MKHGFFELTAFVLLSALTLCIWLIDLLGWQAKIYPLSDDRFEISSSTVKDGGIAHASFENSAQLAKLSCDIEKPNTRAPSCLLLLSWVALSEELSTKKFDQIEIEVTINDHWVQSKNSHYLFSVSGETEKSADGFCNQETKTSGIMVDTQGASSHILPMTMARVLQNKSVESSQNQIEIRHCNIHKIDALQIGIALQPTPGNYEISIKNLVLSGQIMKLSDWSFWLLSAWIILSSIFVAIRLVIFTKKYQSIKHQAERDHLTGLYNRSALNKLNQSIFYGVLFIDLDHFKSINDTYGHETGDNVLVELAALLSKEVRKADTLLRWGGEEFVLLVPNCSFKDTLEVANKILLKVRCHHWRNSVPLTCSIGISTNESTTLSEAMVNADKALYRAKRNGRNRVEFGDQ